MSETTVMLDRNEWSRILQSLDVPEHVYKGVRDLLDVIAEQGKQLTRQENVGLDLAQAIANLQTQITRYEAVVEAARHWALWHTLYSHGRPDEPEEIELKEALEQADE